MYEYTYCVPDLELDNFLIDSESVAAELHANCDLMLLLKLIVHDALHQTRLAHAGVADDNQFEKVVLCWQRLVCQHLKWDLFDLLYLTLFHIVLLYLFFRVICLFRLFCLSCSTANIL